MTGLTEASAARQAPPALLLHVENTYMRDGETFVVRATADWAATEFPVLGDAATSHTYRVAAFLSYVSSAGASVCQSICSGHYIAYVFNGGWWFELHDTSATRLL